MGTKEILDYLSPIFEEDEERLIIEVELLNEDIKLGEISKFYYRGYKDLILAIAEIRREDIHQFIYSD